MDRRGALLAVFILLLVFHFDEIFGIASSQALVFGWWPATIVYHGGINVLHVAFMVLLYYNWPDPPDKDIDQPGVSGGGSETNSSSAATAAEGD